MSEGLYVLQNFGEFLINCSLRNIDPALQFRYLTRSEIEFNNMIGHPPPSTYYFWLGKEEIYDE